MRSTRLSMLRVARVLGIVFLFLISIQPAWAWDERLKKAVETVAKSSEADIDRATKAARSARAEEITAAFKAVQTGSPSHKQTELHRNVELHRQTMLVRRNNDVLNRMATLGKLDNATYQTLQRDFDRFNSDQATRAARDAGLIYGKQVSPEKPYGPGTDSDYILQSKDPDKGLTPADIRKARNAYNNRMNEDFGTRGVDYAKKLDTDLMANPHKVSDADFERIAQPDLNNDAYKRRLAAEYEARKRAIAEYDEKVKQKKIDPKKVPRPAPITQAQSKAFADEMLGMSDKKKGEIDKLRDKAINSARTDPHRQAVRDNTELKGQARTKAKLDAIEKSRNDPSRRNSNDIDAKLTTKQQKQAKYLERLNTESKRIYDEQIKPNVDRKRATQPGQAPEVELKKPPKNNPKFDKQLEKMKTPQPGTSDLPQRAADRGISVDAKKVDQLERQAKARGKEFDRSKVTEQDIASLNERNAAASNALEPHLKSQAIKNNAEARAGAVRSQPIVDAPDVRKQNMMDAAAMGAKLGPNQQGELIDSIRTKYGDDAAKELTAAMQTVNRNRPKNSDGKPPGSGGSGGSGNTGDPDGSGDVDKTSGDRPDKPGTAGNDAGAGSEANSDGTRNTTDADGIGDVDKTPNKGPVQPETPGNDAGAGSDANSDGSRNTTDADGTGDVDKTTNKGAVESETPGNEAGTRTATESDGSRATADADRLGSTGGTPGDSPLEPQTPDGKSAVKGTSDLDGPKTVPDVDVPSAAGGGRLAKGVKVLGALDALSLIEKGRKVGRGEQSLGDAVSEAVDENTLGLYGKGKDYKETSDIAEYEQKLWVDMRLRIADRELERAGVPLEEAREIKNAMRRGDDGPLKAKQAELREQGKKVIVPELSIVPEPQGDEQFGENVLEVPGAVLQGGIDAVATVGGIAKDVVYEIPRNLAGQISSNATTSEQIDVIENDKQRMKEKFIQRGLDPAKVEEAVNNYYRSDKSDRLDGLKAELAAMALAKEQLLKEFPELAKASPEEQDEILRSVLELKADEQKKSDAQSDAAQSGDPKDSTELPLNPPLAGEGTETAEGASDETKDEVDQSADPNAELLALLDEVEPQEGAGGSPLEQFLEQIEGEAGPSEVAVDGDQVLKQVRDDLNSQEETTLDAVLSLVESETSEEQSLPQDSPPEDQTSSGVSPLDGLAPSTSTSQGENGDAADFASGGRDSLAIGVRNKAPAAGTGVGGAVGTINTAGFTQADRERAIRQNKRVQADFAEGARLDRELTAAEERYREAVREAQRIAAQRNAALQAEADRRAYAAYVDYMNQKRAKEEWENWQARQQQQYVPHGGGGGGGHQSGGMISDPPR